MIKKMATTILFFIIIIAITTRFNSYYRNIYDGGFEVSKKYIEPFLANNPIVLYIYVTVLFFLSSRASLFKFSDGYFSSYIKQMLLSLSDNTNEYSKPNPFIGELSIIAVTIFSLLTVISGSGLGSEGVMIFLSVSIMVYLYFKFKKLLNLADINTELLIYTGYIIGFDATFTSLISSVIFIFEKMFINHSSILYTYNAIIILLICLLVHYFIKNRNPILNIGKIQFDYYNVSNLLYIVILSLIIGVLCFLFFTSFISLYNTLKNYKHKNVIVVMFGILLAFMIQTCGLFISGSGESVINDVFKNLNFNNATMSGYIIGSDNINKTFNYKNVFGKMMNCIISLGSGLPGGIVIPAMTIGAGIGSLYSNLLNGKYFESIQNIIPMTMPIENVMYIGMVAFLSPMLDAPITSAVVINQISNQSFDTIPISLVSSFISYYVYKKLHK
jgi:H+/Cl- antiporter ClcA